MTVLTWCVISCWAVASCVDEPNEYPAGQFAPRVTTDTTVTPSSPARTDVDPTPSASVPPDPGTATSRSPADDPASPRDGTPAPTTRPSTATAEASATDHPTEADVGLDYDEVDRTDPTAVAGTFVCGLYASPVEPEDVDDIARRVEVLATDRVVDDLRRLSFHGDAGLYREASVTGLREVADDTFEVTCFVVFRDAETHEPSQPPETVSGRVHLQRGEAGTWQVDRFDQLV